MSPNDSPPVSGPSHAERGRHEAASHATARLLWLYPARYRADHGDEIMSLHCDARLAAEGRIARVREDLDLIAHAGRTRLRISSAFASGRALGSAAPWLVAGAAASAVYALTQSATLHNGRHLPPVTAALNGLLLVALALAVAGFWAWARPLTVLAGAALAGVMAFESPVLHWHSSRIDFLAVTALLVLCAPPDIRPTSRTDRAAMLAAAAAVALPVATWSLGLEVHLPGYLPTTDRGPWTLLVMAVVAFIALLRVRKQPAMLAGAIVATLPWLWNIVFLPDLVGDGLILAVMALIGALLNRPGRDQLLDAS
ncbi:hypothetical protein [Catenulispora subtropica]|uniref:Uncharacterized protein n=1 Tax=Catenulispora subtropica TaxID=450798 RepID=A0ABN2S8T3_9ACTN